MKKLDNDWRDIPGYDGMYQINRDGEVRTYRYRRERRLGRPKLMSQFKHHSGNAYYVKLTDSLGNTKMVKPLNVMVEVFLGGKRDGKVAYHKNGDLRDHNINNIGFITRSELGKNSGAMSRRRPVAKVDRYGEIIAFYSSARTAAKENYMSYQAVMDRCNGKVKKPFDLTGYSFRWDD